MSLRPCGTCRTPVPDGNCPTHLRNRGGYAVSPVYRGQWPTISRAVLNAAGRICAYCGGSASMTDHVIPVARGGTHALTNLVAACRQDNTSKAGRTLVEWIASGLAPDRARVLLAQRVANGLES